jgi:hypothetical protein
LVAVRADDARSGEIETIFARNAGVDAATRGALYRQEGWTRYEEDPALGAETRQGSETRPI